MKFEKTRPHCPCVHCQADRATGRRQYVVRFRATPDDYFSRDADKGRVPVYMAMVFGVHHASRMNRDAFRPVLVKNKSHPTRRAWASPATAEKTRAAAKAAA